LKKIVAILFFSILLFNWIGYRIVIDLVEDQHTRQMAIKVEQADYNESELISVKTYYPLPYLTNTPDFERWDGEVNVNGVVYKYVKRRFINDSIEFLCLPDYRSTQIKNDKENLLRIANDLPQQEQNKKQEKAPAFKRVLSDYCEEITSAELTALKIQLTHFSNYILPSTGFYGNITGQPPDRC
jgi:hypothetical protein